MHCRYIDTRRVPRLHASLLHMHQSLAESSPLMDLALPSYVKVTAGPRRRMPSPRSAESRNWARDGRYQVGADYSLGGNPARYTRGKGGGGRGFSLKLLKASRNSLEGQSRSTISYLMRIATAPLQVSALFRPGPLMGDTYHRMARLFRF